MRPLIAVGDLRSDPADVISCKVFQRDDHSSVKTDRRRVDGSVASLHEIQNRMRITARLSGLWATCD